MGLQHLTQVQADQVLNFLGIKQGDGGRERERQARGRNPSFREVQGEEENGLGRGNGNTPLLQNSSVCSPFRVFVGHPF